MAAQQKRAAGGGPIVVPIDKRRSEQSDMDAPPEVGEISKKPKKVSVTQNLPIDKPIPTKGWPARRYWFYAKVLKRPDWVPGLSDEEQELLRQQAETEQRQERRERATRDLIGLADKVPKLKVAFIQTKGGGATTTTAVHSVSLFGNTTRAMVVATDFNPANGTLGSRLGRDYGDTIDIRTLADKADEMAEFSQFIREARPTRYSVRVISASSIIFKDKKLAGTEAAKILKVINANSEYHFADTANDITTPVSLAIVEDADVLVFTANVGEQDSLRQLGTSMETLRQHGFEEKVNNSVVAISNIPEGRDLSEFRKYLNFVIGDNVVKQWEHLFKGQFLGIPTDPVITPANEVDLEALAWDTYQAYLELNIAIFVQHPQFLRNPSSAFFEKE